MLRNTARGSALFTHGTMERYGAGSPQCCGAGCCSPIEPLSAFSGSVFFILSSPWSKQQKGAIKGSAVSFYGTAPGTVVLYVPAGVIPNTRIARICNPLTPSGASAGHRMISGIDIPPPVIPAMMGVTQAQQRLLESP